MRRATWSLNTIAGSAALAGGADGQKGMGLGTMAWVLALPAAILLSDRLYGLFTTIF